MALSDLNSPQAQQQAVIDQEEARRAKVAADAQAEANDSAVGDLFGTIGAPLSDAFSAETVGGPKAGGWGQAGTQAAGYNANAVTRGQGLNTARIQQGIGALNTATAQGQQAAAQSGQTATNLLGQAGTAGTRAAPTTNYAGADHYASMADSSRNTANDLVSQAGSSAQQDAQLAALNNFASQGPGASAAQAQLAQAGDAAQLSALSMARSGRGAGDSAAALRDAMFSNAQTQGTTAGQMAQLRATEEATHRQQQLQALDAAMGGAGAIRGADTAAAQVAQGTRAQDLQAQQQAAGQSQFNTTTQQNQTQMNDALKLGMTDAALGFTSEGNQTNLGFQNMGNQTNLGFANLGQQAETDYAQLGQNALTSQADYELQQQQMKLEADKANQQADLEKDSGITGMLSSAVGGLFALSDEEKKKDIKRTRDVASWLSGAPGSPRGSSIASGFASGLKWGSDLREQEMNDAETTAKAQRDSEVALSDERAKELEARESALADALDTVGNAPGYSYKYKNPDQPGAKHGTQVSSMAQDLERGALGDRVVFDTPQGKMVNYEEVVKMTPGAITELNRKVKALEAALGRGKAA